MNNITEDKYFEERVDEQIKYYNSKSTLNKKYYNFLKAAQIVLSLVIPLLSGFVSPATNYLKYVIGGVGFIVALITGLLNLFKYKDKWTEYRSITETLKREKFLFLAKAGMYNSEQAFDKFVQRIEELISKENTAWAQYIDESTTDQQQS